MPDGSWLMAQGSGLLAQGSWLMAHGQGGQVCPWGPGARPQVQAWARRAPWMSVEPSGGGKTLYTSYTLYTLNILYTLYTLNILYTLYTLYIIHTREKGKLGAPKGKREKDGAPFAIEFH